MKKILLSLLVVGCLGSPSTAEISSQMQEQLQRHPCNSVNPDRAISGCTNFIKGPDAHLESKAWAYAKRANAYTKLGQYRSAIQDLDKTLQNYPDSFHAHQQRGRAHFYLGNFPAAAQSFDSVLSSRAKNPFDALWRYLALERAGGNGRPLLQSDAAKFELKEWPGPIIEMFLGQRSPESMLAAARANAAQLKSENLCEADFYIGQYHLLRNEIPAAKNAFRQALETNAYTFVEYRGAYEELKRLGETFPADDPRLKVLLPQGVK